MSKGIIARLTRGGGLSAVDVADDDHVDVHLLLTVVSQSAVSSMSPSIAFWAMKGGAGWLTYPMIAVVVLVLK